MVDGSVHKYWWCSGPDPGDTIVYRQLDFAPPLIDPATLIPDFIASSEFQSRFLSPDRLITNLYTGILERFPSVPDVAYWVSQLQAGVPFAQIVTIFFTGPEEAGQLESIPFRVAELYRALLGREPTAQELADHVRRLTPPPQLSPMMTVLRSSPAGAWDAGHICDPSVIKGAFPFQGQIWEYAMLYSGAATLAVVSPNGIGIAFSHDGIHWVKRPTPLLIDSSTPPDFVGLTQATAIRGTGSSDFWLFVLHFSQWPRAWELYYSPDGEHIWFVNSVTKQGIIGGEILEGAFASDGFGSVYLVSDEPGNHAQTNLYRIPWNSLAHGTWEWLGAITASLVGQPVIQGWGWRTDAGGSLGAWLPEIVLLGAGSPVWMENPLTWELYTVVGVLQ